MRARRGEPQRRACLVSSRDARATPRPQGPLAHWGLSAPPRPRAAGLQASTQRGGGGGAQRVGGAARGCVRACVRTLGGGVRRARRPRAQRPPPPALTQDRGLAGVVQPQHQDARLLVAKQREQARQPDALRRVWGGSGWAPKPTPPPGCPCNVGGEQEAHHGCHPPAAALHQLLPPAPRCCAAIAGCQPHRPALWGLQAMSGRLAARRGRTSAQHGTLLSFSSCPWPPARPFHRGCTHRAWGACLRVQPPASCS